MASNTSTAFGGSRREGASFLLGAFELPRVRAPLNSVSARVPDTTNLEAELANEV
jgi:hypothetical protein